MDLPTEITSLSVDERIRLVEAIWESIAAEPGEPKVTEPQRQELERRLAEHAASPETAISWEQVLPAQRTASSPSCWTPLRAARRSARAGEADEEGRPNRRPASR